MSLVTTLADKVIPMPAGDADDLATLAPCNHQEANTRMLLHLKHASDNGYPDQDRGYNVIVLLFQSPMTSLSLNGGRRLEQEIIISIYPP